jgi:predicted DNA-binding protein (MmcQ/YjbR family)
MARGPAKRAEDELIAYAATFPAAWVDHPWEHTVMKVGKKVFVFFGGKASPDDCLSVTVKLPVSAEMVLATLPFFIPAGHGLGRAGWVHATLHDGEDIDTASFRAWIDQSYRAVATKTLVKQLDAAGAGG